MAVYKVIQDVEAEDKLIGPLSMKQFIFACVAVGFGFVGFLIASKTHILAFVPFLPFIIIPGALAAPLGKDQPTDIWLAAKIRFLIKPRKRIWSQDGIKNLVTITVPKKIEHTYTNGLDEQQVKSRLKALADTIDTRGWAAKSEDLNLFTSPLLPNTDRLVSFNNLPQAVPDINISASDDILDARYNTEAQQMDAKVKTSTYNIKKSAIERMFSVTNNSAPQSPPTDSSVMNTGNQTSGSTTSAQDELLITEQLKHNLEKAKLVAELSSPHHKAIKTTSQLAADDIAKTKETKAAARDVTPQKNPDIVKLASTDFSVATIAGLANRNNQASGEVVVNLH